MYVSDLDKKIIMDYIKNAVKNKCYDILFYIGLHLKQLYICGLITIDDYHNYCQELKREVKANDKRKEIS